MTFAWPAPAHPYIRTYGPSEDAARPCLSCHSPDGAYRYASPACETLLGYTPAELVHSGAYVRFHPDDIAAVRASHDALLTTASLSDAAGRPVGAFATVTDITARKHEEERLRHVAHHDVLTGLPNRALFADRLTVALAAATRHDEPLAVLLLDLDRFKWVNDTLGHAAGDTLLRVVADRLRAALRAEDTVARLGGDEFAAILPGTDEQGALVATEKLLSALAVPVLLDDRPVDVGGSIGIALSPAHGVDQASLLRCADVAMYQAKREHLGRAVYVVERDEHTPERLSLSAELRQALAAGHLVLHYQPVLDLEALVRWPHPTRGLLLPRDFLPLAEETGLSAPLTGWVLEEAVRQCRMWQDVGLEIGVTVNLAGAALRDGDLVQRVRTVLEHHAISPRCLMLEISEDAAMTDPERTIAQVSALRDIGLQVALDDVGTGQSSLAYL